MYNVHITHVRIFFYNLFVIYAAHVGLDHGALNENRTRARIAGGKIYVQHNALMKKWFKSWSIGALGGSGVRNAGFKDDLSASTGNPRMCVFVKGHEKQAEKM